MGIIALLITILIAMFIFFGFKGLDHRNQVQEGQNAINQANDAAKQEQNSNFYIQDQLNGGADVNYHSAVDKARELK